MKKLRLIGPFKQLISLVDLPLKGSLSDDQLEIVEDAGILVGDERIEATGAFRELKTLTSVIEQVEGEWTVMPGMVDAHTHICWAGSRVQDYALRLSGRSYVEIGRLGGGIWSTVIRTRDAKPAELITQTKRRAEKLLYQGITTIEVKSGYGLETDSELKILRVIKKVNETSQADLIATCLAAHIKPMDFNGSARDYLDYIICELLPVVKTEKLASRVDIYVDESAFSPDDARFYLRAARKIGFDVAVHADQFNKGGLKVAAEVEAQSADHLEVTSDDDIQLIARSNVVPIALPGSSLGLGTGFAPARKLLNAGASLAIASDWNPGSAPMGNLLMQAAVLGIYEKLTMAETLTAVTCRAAESLKLKDRGSLKPGMLADFIAFPCSDYREILYNQGGMVPGMVWKRGNKVKNEK